MGASSQETTGSGRGRVAASACVLLACVGFGCGAARQLPPNVLLVVLDACRPDKLGCYGFDRPTSPTIDRLAADPDSILFGRHYVQAPWTKPSTASLFTGLFVHQHRVTLGREATPTADRLAVLAPEHDTLAEAFDRAGYSTFSATENHQLNRAYGFDQGFDIYRMTSGGDRRLAQVALELVASAEPPFFGYVHFVGCHYPFPEYLRHREYLAGHGFPYREAERASHGIDFTSPTLRLAINERGLELEPDDVRFLNLVYEAKLRKLDEIALAPLLDGVRDRGLWDDTMIVLTADHGEELYEHRGYAHGQALWEEIVRVPLVVKYPHGARPGGVRRRDDLTNAIDLFPTLAEVADLEAPADLPGRSLAAPRREGFAYSESGTAEWAVIAGHEKAIWSESLLDPTPAAAVARVAQRYLFDLSVDPGERENLIASRRDSFSRAQDMVSRLRLRYPPLALAAPVMENPELDAEAIETLRSLGYVE